MSNVSQPRSILVGEVHRSGQSNGYRAIWGGKAVKNTHVYTTLAKDSKHPVEKPLEISLPRKALTGATTLYYKDAPSFEVWFNPMSVNSNSFSIRAAIRQEEGLSRERSFTAKIQLKQWRSNESVWTHLIAKSKIQTWRFKGRWRTRTGCF